MSNAVLGTAFSGLMLVYALMQFPSGILADRIGSVRIITAGVLLAAISALILVMDSPFIVLVGVMLLLGAGTGAHKPVAIELLSRTYPQRTGLAFGVFDTFGTLAGVVAPTAVVVFVGLPGIFGDGWRTVFLVAGLTGVGLAVAFAYQVPKRLPETPVGDSNAIGTDDFAIREYASLFHNWKFTTFVAVAILFSFAYNGVIAFLPLYLTDEASLTAANAGLLYGALFATSPVQLLTGEVSDRIGTLPVMTISLGLAVIGISGLITVTAVGEPLILGAMVVCLGLGGNGFRPVRGAYLVSVLPESVTGGGLGVVRTLLMAAGALAPAVTGYLSGTAGFRAAFWLLTAALIVAVVAAGLLWVNDR